MSRRFGIARFGAAAALLLLVGACATKTKAPSANPEERAAAVARPGVVYLETHWSGYVRDQSDGQLWLTKPTTFSSACSGFVVNPDGYVVTAGHCVDPGVEGAAPTFFAAVARAYIDAGELDPSEAGAFINRLQGGSVVEGEAAGTPPDRQIYVQQGVATSGLRTGQVYSARLINFSKNSEGDVALLKVEREDLPALELAPSSEIETGTPILAIGYPGTAQAVSDTTLEPTNKDGKVSAKRTVGGVPFYEISAATTQGMSGGPVVDLRGRVAGLVSFKPAEETQAFNFISPSSIIRETLKRSGVKSGLGPNDGTYRAGLDFYYEGKYEDAVERFDAVLDVVPSHQQAQEFRRKAKAATPKGGGAPVVPLVIAVVLLGAIIGGLLLWGRRKRPLPVVPAPSSAELSISTPYQAPAPQYQAPTPPPYQPPAPPPAPAPVQVPAQVHSGTPAYGPQQAAQPAPVSGTNGGQRGSARTGDRTCTSCGAWLQGTPAFCTKCGAKLS